MSDTPSFSLQELTDGAYLAAQLLAITTSDDPKALEDIRVSLLGKKGVITLALKQMGGLTVDERKELGAAINVVKAHIQEALDNQKHTLTLAEESQRLQKERLDLSLPASARTAGGIHPITQATDEMVAILQDMGFAVRTGPLIEDEEHNFSALNIPDMHPARQMHDTFYVRELEQEPQNPDNYTYLLRTHTSPVQIRAMRDEGAPLRIIAPGSTFRCDSDQTHTPMFHQIEGLCIDKDIHMGHLQHTIQTFLARFFNVERAPIRLRPSFFPFTEPSAEVDIACKRTKDAIIIGEGDDWLEVMGCGMVHPNVLRACGIEEPYQGFAFGAGIERLAMLKYNIPDLRDFFASDPRWLQHYSFTPLLQPGSIVARDV